MKRDTFLGHPKGLFLLFASELWERFSFYALRAVLVLYLTALTIDGGLGWSKADALRLYGIYTGLIYITPLIGGALADNTLGQRKAVLFGAVLMAAGQFVLSAFPSGLYAGLLLLICGNGLFKPNISTMVGDLYDKNDTRRDSAFTIFYMGINIGSFFAGIAAGFILMQWSFQTAFFVAGLGMLIALGLQLCLAKRYLGNIGTLPAARKVRNESKAPLSRTEIAHLKALMTLGVFSVVFWAGFEQAGGLLTLFAEEQTNRTIAGLTVPTAFFQSLNPLFIILLAPVFAWIWAKAGDKAPSFAVKFVWALAFSALGFLFMIGAAWENRGGAQASMLWLVATYFFHTVGELCLSPTGLSMVAKLAPARYLSLMMGVWFCFAAAANFTAGFVGAFLDDWGALPIFVALFGISLIAAFVLRLMSNRLERLAAK